MTPRGLLFGIYFYMVTVCCQILFLPFLLTPMPVFRRFAGLWCWLVLQGLRWIVGVRWEWRGMDLLPDQPFILACKHQSTWETLSFMLYLDYPAFVLKQELIKIPVFGWYLKKVGSVAVDRSAGAKALRKMIEDAQAYLKDGRRIVIFPEGTRTPVGSKNRYHAGLVALYRDSGYPIVPAALNSGQVWPRSIWRCRPGTIVVEFLPLIPQGLKRPELMTRLEGEIETSCARLNLVNK